MWEHMDEKHTLSLGELSINMRGKHTIVMEMVVIPRFLLCDFNFCQPFHHPPTNVARD
jgi:hypothetical protein